jgi:hypothetical protein
VTSSSVGVGGDDNREWTITKGGRDSWIHRVQGPAVADEPVVPRSRLERVEAERDQLREALRGLADGVGGVTASMGEGWKRDELHDVLEAAERVLKEGDPE